MGGAPPYCLEKSAAERTSRGRARSPATVDVLDARLRAEAAQRLFLAVVGIEDGQQLRDRQQIVQPLREVHQFDLSAGVLYRHRRGDECAEAGAVHVGDAAEIHDDLFPLLENEAVDLVLQQRVAVTEHEFAVAIEHCCRTNGTLLNRHVPLLWSLSTGV